MDSELFDGFSGRGQEFLAGLVKNNEREWFQARKEVYTNEIVAPAQAFIVALGERLKLISPHIQYDTRTNGSGSLLRIYRDVRFSKDKSPYKSYVGMVFWEGPLKKMENPGFYFGFDATGGTLHIGSHGFSKAQLAAYRTAVGESASGEGLEAVLTAVQQPGTLNIGGEHYKRVPRGFPADHPRAELLRYAGLYASSQSIPWSLLKSPDIVDHIFDLCTDGAALHKWLVALNEKASSA